MLSLALSQSRTFWELVPEQEEKAPRGRALSDSLLMVSSNGEPGDSDSSTVYSESNVSSEFWNSQEVCHSDAEASSSDGDHELQRGHLDSVSSEFENSQEVRHSDAEASSFEVGPPPGSWKARPRRITLSRKGTYRMVQQRTSMGLSEARQQTTLLIRNLPKDFSRSHLLQFLNQEGCMGFFDFAYVPYNFKKGAAFGYALVNFVTPAFAQAFVHHQASRNVGLRCEWSKSLQGLTALLQRYKQSPVMKISEEHRPLFLHARVHRD